jgi:hypothetical protein
LNIFHAIVEHSNLQTFAKGYNQKKNIAQAIFMDSGSWFTIETLQKIFYAKLLKDEKFLYFCVKYNYQMFGLYN